MRGLPPAPEVSQQHLRSVAPAAKGSTPAPVVTVRSSRERTKKVKGEVVHTAPPVDQEDRFPFTVPVGDNPAFVTAGLGRTVKLEDFEFLRVDVWITRPCANTDEAVAAAKQEIFHKATEFLGEELDRAGV